MAGAGRRVFQPGEVLTASNVMSYLQDQAVMVFDSSAARGSAIGTATVSEGMTTYLKDSDALEFYNGTAWTRFAAGTGLPIANGGTGGTSVAAAQDNLGIGLVPIVPSSVGLSGGSQTTSSNGLVTFTGSNYIQLNGIFSSAYSFYRIYARWQPSGTVGDIYTRTTTGGVVDTGNYSWVGNYTVQNGTNSAWVALNFSYLPASFGGLANSAFSYTADVWQPSNGSLQTKLQVQLHNWNNNWTASYYGGIAEFQQASDGIRFSNAPNINFGGIIQVFGFNA